MGNATSWLAQTLTPEEQVLWVAAKSGDLATLRAGLSRLTPQTRHYAEWKDPMFGYSPLANACLMGHMQCAQALVAAGVDCNARDMQGCTPLHIATAHGKSEVVRLLLDTLAVDYFAKTTLKAQTALDLARQAYRRAEGNGGHKFIQCVELIEKKLCIYSGWLYERTDNLLSLASGISSLTSWRKRYVLVLKTGDRNVVEIDLFPMKPGERRPPCPSVELLYRANDGLQESDEITWLSRKEFRFALTACQKSGTSRVASPKSMDFAATTQQELAAWKTFFANLRAHGPSLIDTAFGRSRDARPSEPASAPRNSISSQAALLQEQRDLERAIQLSTEEARRNSSAYSSPSAPPPSDTMLETIGYPQTTVGPDGVEIVQQLEDDSYAVHSSAPGLPLAPSSLKSVAVDEDSESKAGDTGGECVICFDGPQSAVCVPCGHNAICMDCANELLDTTRLCPVCRQSVREVIRIYRV